MLHRKCLTIDSSIHKTSSVCSGSTTDNGLVSPHLRTSCDVYIGFCSRKPSVLRYVNWLHAELQLHGVSCFTSSRSKCHNIHSHVEADSAMDSATVGIVIITRRTFSNSHSMNEVKLFMKRKNMLAIFYGRKTDNLVEGRGGVGEEWKQVVDSLSHLDFSLEANSNNLRDCITEAVLFVGTKLGRRCIVEKERKWKKWVESKEHLFPRSNFFIGRKEELEELELMLFGYLEKGISVESLELKGQYSLKKNFRSNGVMKSNLEDRERKGKAPMLVEEIDDNEIDDISKRKKRSSKECHGKGFACVSGEAGVGKTELVLEFSYKFAQRYKMVLWISGKAKYFWQNYMNLFSSMGFDSSLENEKCFRGNESRSFEEIENQGINLLKKELTRGIPFLIVIDNLEAEKEWWRGLSVMDLLPRVGSETHIVISTRLNRVMGAKPLKVMPLSDSEAMLLMKGQSRDYQTEDVNALAEIGEKVGRIPFALSIVQAIVSELKMSPQKLLDVVCRMPETERVMSWSDQEDLIMKKNPLLVQLLDFCLLVFNLADGSKNTTSRMIYASCWFAPSPVPVSLLLFVAYNSPGNHCDIKSWRRWLHSVSCKCATSKSSGCEKSSRLVRFRFARMCNKKDLIWFHDITRIYARKRESIEMARSVVRAVNSKACVSHHWNHAWEACFLLFNFKPNTAIVDLKVSELVSFIKKLVIPLAVKTFTVSCNCNAAIELLRRCSEKLQLLEDTYLSDLQTELDNSSWWGNSKNPLLEEFDPHLYRDFSLLRAKLLETRAELMQRGGLSDIGEELYRNAITIKEVFLGSDHWETTNTREKIKKLEEPN